MKRIITILVVALIMCGSALGQSAGYRASGLYQRAKEFYDGGNYSQALSYAKQSRETLSGTNRQLQYMFVMIYVKQNDWTNANKEKERFYGLLDNLEKSVYFPGTTDELTRSEEADLTRMMIEIEEKATRMQSDIDAKAAYASSPQAKREKVAKEIVQWFDTYLAPTYNTSFYYKFTGKTNYYELTCRAYSKSNGVFYVEKVVNMTGGERGTRRESATTKFDNLSKVETAGNYKFYNYTAYTTSFNSIYLYFTNAQCSKVIPESMHSGVGNINDTDNCNFIRLPVGSNCTSSAIEKINELIKKYKEIK